MYRNTIICRCAPNSLVKCQILLHAWSKLLRSGAKTEAPVRRHHAACHLESTGTTGTTGKTAALFPLHQSEAEGKNNIAFITAPTGSAPFSPNAATAAAIHHCQVAPCQILVRVARPSTATPGAQNQVLSSLGSVARR